MCTCVHVSVHVDHLDYLIYSIQNVVCTYIKYVCKSTSSCIYLPLNNQTHLISNNNNNVLFQARAHIYVHKSKKKKHKYTHMLNNRGTCSEKKI